MRRRPSSGRHPKPYPKCEELNVSKSGRVCPIERTSMRRAATSLNGMDRPRSRPTSEHACGVTKTRRHAMPRKVGTAIVTISIDPGKNTMHLDDRFRETGLDEASIHGTGIKLVDSSFEKI